MYIFLLRLFTTFQLFHDCCIVTEVFKGAETLAFSHFYWLVWQRTNVMLLWKSTFKCIKCTSEHNALLTDNELFSILIPSVWVLRVHLGTTVTQVQAFSGLMFDFMFKFWWEAFLSSLKLCCSSCDASQCGINLLLIRLKRLSQKLKAALAVLASSSSE